MPQFSDIRVISNSIENVYAVVADVEKYPSYLPWCHDLRIVKKEDDNLVYADMVVLFKRFEEKFTSRITFDRPYAITAVCVDGPLRFLEATWKFSSISPESTLVSIHVSFEFRNKLFDILSNIFVDRAIEKMVNAFESRVTLGAAGKSSPRLIS